MIIEGVDFLDTYNLIKLTISGEDFLVDIDSFNELFLSVDQEIDFDTYKIILANDSFNRAKNYALDKISYAQKTSFEVRKLLKDKDFDETSIEKTIVFLNDYGIIDDEMYVKSFIKDKHSISRWSKNKIRYALKGKNIPDQLIEKYIYLIDDDEEYENAYTFALKKVRNDFSFENKQKVYRNLASKGFDYDIISRVLGELFK